MGALQSGAALQDAEGHSFIIVGFTVAGSNNHDGPVFDIQAPVAEGDAGLAGEEEADGADGVDFVFLDTVQGSPEEADPGLAGAGAFAAVDVAEFGDEAEVCGSFARFPGLQAAI